MKKKIIILSVIGILILIGVFWAGLFWGQNKNQTFDNNKFGPGMQNRDAQFNGMMNGRSRTGMGGFGGGEIISKDDKSITVKSMDGSSRIIFFDSNTVVSKMVAGTMSDLSVGTNISINGSTNTDGSITAKSIQIRPEFKQNIPIKQ